MEIINNITNTKPLVLHAYGASHVGHEWNTICSSVIDTFISLPNDITIISFFFGENKFALKEQLLGSNIPFIDASQNIETSIWQHREKIRMVDIAIKNITTKYVLVLDGIDVLLSKNIDSIVNKFELLDCKLLYNSCVYSHPLSFDYESDSVEGVGIFNKLNSGAFIGETAFIADFYKDLMTIYDDVNIPCPDTDGIRIGLKYKNYPEIKVDYNCDIFQTLLGTESEFKNGVLTVKRSQP